MSSSSIAGAIEVTAGSVMVAVPDPILSPGGAALVYDGVSRISEDVDSSE